MCADIFLTRFASCEWRGPRVSISRSITRGAIIRHRGIFWFISSSINLDNAARKATALMRLSRTNVLPIGRLIRHACLPIWDSHVGILFCCRYVLFHRKFEAWKDEEERQLVQTMNDSRLHGFEIIHSVNILYNLMFLGWDEGRDREILLLGWNMDCYLGSRFLCVLIFLDSMCVLAILEGNDLYVVWKKYLQFGKSIFWSNDFYWTWFLHSQQKDFLLYIRVLNTKHNWLGVEVYTSLEHCLQFVSLYTMKQIRLHLHNWLHDVSNIGLVNTRNFFAVIFKLHQLWCLQWGMNVCIRSWQDFKASRNMKVAWSFFLKLYVFWEKNLILKVI